MAGIHVVTVLQLYLFGLGWALLSRPSAPSTSSGQASDRGFRTDKDLETWLDEQGFSRCDVSESSWTGDVPVIRRVPPVPSKATFSEFLGTVEKVRSRTVNNNQGWFSDLVDAAQLAEVVRNKITTPQGPLGQFQQANADLGIFGLTGYLMFNYKKVAPELYAIAEENKDDSETRMDVVALSRHGFNFHRHDGFRFRPLRGKKLFIMAPSEMSYVANHGMDVPVGLREVDLVASGEGSNSSLTFDLLTLPSILLLQTHIDWFHKNKLMFCVVGENDELTVPDWWWHLTLSVGDSLSFTKFGSDESREPGPLPSLTGVLDDIAPCSSTAGSVAWSFATPRCIDQGAVGRARSLQEVCPLLPPRPSHESALYGSVCEVSYRFLSAWCAEATGAHDMSVPSADEILLDASAVYKNAAAEGGAETAWMVQRLLGAWEQLVHVAGRSGLASSLASRAREVMRTPRMLFSEPSVFQLTEPTARAMRLCPELRQLVFASDQIRTAQETENLLALAHP